MMKQNEKLVWFGTMFIGCGLTRALAHRHPLAAFLTLCASGVLFLVWLLRDNLLFRKELDAEHERLAERKAAFRAARDADRTNVRR